LDIVKYLESKGADDWNEALYQASRGGHLDIVKYTESKSKDIDWNRVLICGASEGGHLDIVKYAESKGANNWNLALTRASFGGNLDIVKYAESINIKCV